MTVRDKGPKRPHRLLTAREAADRLGLSARLKHPERAVLRLVRDGDLVGVPVSRFMHVTEESVDRLICG